ncbi:MAG TPA: hypothetical protein VD971_05305 [Phycisphaerales bacterium]|nr:hypothetical protein [Phycisphaerales bacterium]
MERIDQPNVVLDAWAARTASTAAASAPATTAAEASARGEDLRVETLEARNERLAATLQLPNAALAAAQLRLQRVE